MIRGTIAVLGVAFTLVSSTIARGNESVIPDGRTIAPAGFTIPVEGFPTVLSLSPDGALLAVLSLDGHAVDVLDSHASVLVDRLVLPSATGMTWTPDGLYVAQGYRGTVARFSYDPNAHGAAPALARRADIAFGGGLINGVAEDSVTHRVAVARTAAHEVVVANDGDGSIVERLGTSGQPFDVAFSGAGIVATLYDTNHVDVWPSGAGAAVHRATGPHPTRLLAAGGRVFVADADGHDVVELAAPDFSVVHRYDLSVRADQPPGQTPSGMALSDDGDTLYVAESGFNDVAVLDRATGRVVGRIPTGWYPTAVAYAARSAVGKKDPRKRQQLWIANGKGLGSQPDPAGEWNGTYTGLVQHLIVEPSYLDAWSASVARNDRFAGVAVTPAFPPIGHVVVIVRENKHFDEEFGDEPNADADPTLLLYGRTYTPNAHALAERFTLFDNFMSDGEASIYGHAWLVQGMTNDYHERNAHSQAEGVADAGPQIAFSIWPYATAGADTVSPADMDFDWYRDLAKLPNGPRMNVSGVFGPRGELIDELQRRGVSYRVYGEQMTMEPDGEIAPGLAAHAARDYPGTHINFGVLDTIRAKLFLADVASHGLAKYSYLTLPTDHTAGTKPGFLTPASFVVSNDAALGQIVDGLSKRPEWKDTIVIVTPDDAQGTGDHVDSHRLPVFVAGPYVRRGFVDHTRYALPSILRTVEVAFGLSPLNTYDAAATPIADAFALQPEVDAYAALPETIPIVLNPGPPAAATSFDIDGPDSADIPDQEWASIKGARSLAQHEAYLANATRVLTWLP